MIREHIVVLKKIPVDPEHIDALRLGGGRREPPPPSTHEEEQKERVHGHSSSPLFRLASFLLFLTFLSNPVLVAYAEEGASRETPAQSVEVPPPVETPVPETTVVLPPDETEPADSGSSEAEEPRMAEGGTPSPEEEESSVFEGEHVNETEESTLLEETPIEETSSGGGEGTAGSLEEALTDEQGTTTEDILPGGEGQATTTDETSATSTSTNEDASRGVLGEGDTGTTTESIGTSTEQEIVAIPEVEPEADPETALEREQTPEERAAERAAAEAAMREQIRREVEAEIRAECVSYGDDGYYCLDKASARRISETRPVERVVSERTSGADKEIILVRTLPEGETREFITENDVDDEFPNADGPFDLIVWQSLVSGRWQIAYKEGTSSIAYLTVGGNGNGHPVTDGRNIVWQSWLGDQWDIFIAEPRVDENSMAPVEPAVLDGVHPGWTVRKLSESTDHDMFPKIAGNVVTWQEHHGDRWVIAVHDLATGATRTIEPESGGTGEDPTIAVLYKERTSDGRIAVRARDLVTGEAIPLRADEMPELPRTLPIPEQQGALPAQAGTSTTTVIRPEGEGDDPTPEI